MSALPLRTAQALLAYALLTVSMLAFAATPDQFAGGDGSAGDPYQIATVEQLDLVREDLAAHYRLIADLYVGSAYESSPYYQDGLGWEPIGTNDDRFAGTFDGDGYTITDLFIYRSDTDYVGLFGALDSDSRVTDLKIHNAFIVGGHYTGVLAGHSNGEIDGFVSTRGFAGGKVGVGGIVGFNGGLIQNSGAGITVNDWASGASGTGNVGGIAGINTDTIQDSYVVGSAHGDEEGDGSIGGLVGLNQGTLTRTYVLFTGLTGPENVGGLVGFNEGEIHSSYTKLFEGISHGEFGNDIGALVGLSNASGIIDDSTSFTTEIDTGEGGTLSIDLIADNQGTSFSSIELSRDTIWNMNSAWSLHETFNDAVPYLAWQTVYIPPSLTSFGDTPLYITEAGIPVTITFEDLLAASDATDSDGSVVGFRFNGWVNGRIWVDGEQVDEAVIRAGYEVQWVPPANTLGTLVAIDVSAMDDHGVTSDNYQQRVSIVVTVNERSYVPVESTPLPNQAWSYNLPFGLDLRDYFTAKHDTHLSYAVDGLPEGFELDASEGVIRGTLTLSDDFEQEVPDVRYPLTVSVTADDGDESRFEKEIVLGFFQGGNPDNDEPLQIATAEQLDLLRDFLEPEHQFKLTRHIALLFNDYPWEDDDAGWQPIGSGETPFQGTLDGNYYSINGIAVEREDTNDVGLFGALGEHASVFDLQLVGVEVYGMDRVGSLAGSNAGEVSGVTMFEGGVYGQDGVGGLIGLNTGSVRDSGVIFAEVGGRDGVGGMIGDNADGLIESGLYLNLLGLEGAILGRRYVGALAGANSGTINDSAGVGIVEADEDGGVLIGINSGGGVVNRVITLGGAFVNNNVTTQLFGRNDGTVNDSFWVQSESPEDNRGGTMLSSLEDVSDIDTYLAANWDFDDAWIMTPEGLYQIVAPAPRWFLNQPGPRMSKVDSPFEQLSSGGQSSEFSAPDISLKSDGDWMYPEDYMYRVTAVHHGTLLINGEVFEPDDNDSIGDRAGDSHFVWIPDEDDTGLVDAFSVVAIRNNGLLGVQESNPPVVVQFLVNASPAATTIPDDNLFTLTPYVLDLRDFFSDPEDDAITFSASGLPEGLSLVNGIISGTPTETGEFNIGITATDVHGAENSTQFTLTITELPVTVPEDDTPPPPAVPNVGGDTSQLDEDLDNIQLPPPGQEIPQEVLQQITQAVEKAAEIVNNAAQQIANGTLSTGTALGTLQSANKAIGKAGEAGNTDTASALKSLNGVSSVLSSLAGRGNLSEDEKRQVSDIAKDSLSNSGNLISANSTPEEVESVLTTTADVLNNALKTGAPLNQELATAAVQVSLKALNQVLPGFAAALGKDVDLNDPQQVRELMAEPAVLESALKNSIAVRSTESLDDTQAESSLAAQGVNVDAAKRILESLRSAISNPSGISVAGDSTQSATQALLDALLGAFGSGSGDALQGPGGHLFAATEGLKVNVDPVTGAVEVSSATQRYAVTSTAVRLVAAAVPEGVSYLPDGRAVAVSNGMAIELAPAAVDLLGFAAAIERQGFAVDFRNNGSFSLTLTEGQRFSGSFAFDDVGVQEQACGEISFSAPEGYAPGDAEYAFSMACANGIRQHILPFVHDAAFYSSISAEGLTVRTDRNSGIISITGVGRFKPSFFVSAPDSDDTAYRAEKGNPAVAFRAMPNEAGGTDFDLITATGVQRLYALP